MTWPAFLEGVGAMFVRTDNDPDVQLERITPTPTWVAVKVNGNDIVSRQSILDWCARVRSSHPHIAIGWWVYNYGPPKADVNAWTSFYGTPPFVIYDVEAEYKTDEGAPASWPLELVAAHPSSVPAAVTSYGAIPGNGNFPSSIDFGAFARAGWSVLPQLYDGFAPPDDLTYATSSPQKFPGPYPLQGLHQLVRSLTLAPTMAVYRPEGIDG